MLIATLAAATIAVASAPPPSDTNCAPQGPYEFICGVDKPEDLIALDGTEWVAASGFDKNAGNLYLINSRTRRVRSIVRDPGLKIAPSPTYACDQPPSDGFVTHGLAVRKLAPGRFRLFAVNHSSRESIEIFEVDARTATPSTTWTGCIVMQNGVVANSVTALADGRVIFSETYTVGDPALGLAVFQPGRPTGAVYVWQKGVTRVLDTPRFSVPNGLLTSADDRWLYLNSWNESAIWRLDLSGKSAPARLEVDFRPDNMRWAGRSILSTGQAAPAARFVACSRKADRPVYCEPHWKAVKIDPLKWTITHTFENSSPGFGDVTVALPVGDRLWLGSLGNGARVAVIKAR